MAAAGQSVREDDGTKLSAGNVVASVKTSYVVIKLLGEGGFGAVYKVSDQADKNKEYAMKVEKKMEKRKHSKLKMEVAILKLVSEVRAADNSHFTAIIDRGKKEKYFFLVMDLVGRSLDDLKKLRPSRVFSVGTGLGAGMQCLEAIEDLTKCGFIHRDIKPANYACGLESKQHLVYLLDFGIARRILNDDNELKTPRSQVGFKGTVRFASLSCHRNIEMGPKDDCESWFYLLLDLMVLGGLPWRKLPDKIDVMKCKEESRKGRGKLFQGLNKCQESLGKILDYIDSLGYSDKVDYSFIYHLLKVAAIESNVQIDGLYDWEYDAPPPADGPRTRDSDNKGSFSMRKMTIRANKI